MRVILSPPAATDIVGIGEYIHRDSPAAAARFRRQLRERCARLADAPHAGKPRPEFGDSMRSVPVGFYVIFYDVFDNLVIVQRVLHSARDVSKIFDTRG